MVFPIKTVIIGIAILTVAALAIFFVSDFDMNADDDIISVSEWRNERDTYEDGKIVKVKGSVTTMSSIWIRIGDIGGSGDVLDFTVLGGHTVELRDILVVTIIENRDDFTFDYDVINYVVVV